MTSKANSYNQGIFTLEQLKKSVTGRYGEVTSTGNCYVNHTLLSPEAAIELAHWILDVFVDKDPPADIDEKWGVQK